MFGGKITKIDVYQALHIGQMAKQNGQIRPERPINTGFGKNVNRFISVAAIKTEDVSKVEFNILGKFHFWHILGSSYIHKTLDTAVANVIHKEFGIVNF